MKITYHDKNALFNIAVNVKAICMKHRKCEACPVEKVLGTDCYYLKGAKFPEKLKTEFILEADIHRAVRQNEQNLGAPHFWESCIKNRKVKT